MTTGRIYQSSRQGLHC